MNAEQLRQVKTLAESGTDLSNIDDSVLHGCANESFKQVHATTAACARLMRWQCIMLNGEWDSHEFNELARIFRRKVIVI